MDSNKQTITPWEATCESKFDYTKAIIQFGVQPIDDKLLTRFEKVTQKKTPRLAQKRNLLCPQRTK